MIAFAVVFGLLAVFLANAWLNNRADEARRSLEAQRKAAPPAHTIVVARRPLRFGDVLSTLSLREIPWPKDAVPAGAFGKVGDLTATKRIVLAPIEVNEPILASKITGQGQRATLSSMLNDGMKAVTIRVNDVEGVAGFVQPGDHVDVVLTRPGERKTSINDVIIQNLRVLAVDQLADQTTEKPIVVKAVTLEIAETATRQLTNADLAQGAGQTEDARSITIAVTRPTKDGTTRDEFNVPVERRDAHTAVLPAREMAHD